MRMRRLAVLLLPLAGGCAHSSAATASAGGPSTTEAAASAARARPTSGHDVVRMMHDRYVGKWYRTVSFQQRTEIRLPNDSVVTQTWWEVGRIPGLLRIDRLANDGRNVVIFRGDSTYSRRDGGPFTGRQGRNELLTLGFDVYAQAPDETVRVLVAGGYDMSKVSEATWQGRPVWVVGALAGDSTSTQFWVDRERLVYVRSLERGVRDSTQRAEVVFGAYEPLGGGWIAKEVTVSEGGKVLQREVYSDVKADVPVSPDFFDPSKV